MKILIAAGIYPPDAGGPALHAEAHMKGFPRLGIETEVVALAHFRSYVMGLRHILFFNALLEKVPSADVVYAHDALGVGWPALLAAKLYGKKYVLRVGGDVVWERQGGEEALSMLEWYEQGKQRQSLRFYLSRLVLRRADLVIVPSKLLLRLYVKYYGVAAGRIEVIPNPVPERSTSTEPASRTILFASRLVKYKNLDFVLRALQPILLQDQKLRCMIIGEGPERRHLEKLSHELGLTAKVTFTGALSQQEVLRATAKCLFVVAPALTEFNPNYLLQALSFGKPFLISREHGLPFEVPHELIFDPRDEEGFQEKVLNLLTDAGYHRATQFVGSLPFAMSWEDNLRANEKLLSALLDGSK